MQVNLSAQLSDRFLDPKVSSSQRQVALSVSALVSQSQQAPLNLCLVLDQSGSMAGKPLDTVKRAACALVDQMSYQDYISVVSFDHKARIIVEHQLVDRAESIKEKIQGLRSAGGTAIDEGMKLALQELSKLKTGVVSQAFILTDGENEHGDNQRCLQFAQLAAEYGITLHTLGFGDDWNQNVLEQIADAGNGAMCHIQTPEQAAGEFSRLLQRIQSVYLTNAFLELALPSHVRLAELKPIAQVSPDAIELPVQIHPTNNLITVRLGDLMHDVERVVIVNLYIDHQIFSQANQHSVPILTAQVRYDLPADCQTDLLSSPIDAVATLAEDFKPGLDPQVQTHILALAKYRQTQLAETKLNQGDRLGAATMLQSAAKTALQMGDQHAATVLQTNATRLQSGSDLNDAERKQTRMVSKTVLQVPEE
ncbi:MAG: VWA domain-containing protein [Pseudanabaenaceae cyanobacterium bins.68]|nr:VWA domain-containing protein [Pseudanabaenaceae cyanobacterium bins.68]